MANTDTKKKHAERERILIAEIQRLQTEVASLGTLVQRTADGVPFAELGPGRVTYTLDDECEVVDGLVEYWSDQYVKFFGNDGLEYCVELHEVFTSPPTEEQVAAALVRQYEEREGDED